MLHPLPPADPHLTEPGGARVSPASSQSVPAPSPSSPDPRSEKTENRSDSGQFRSDSHPQPSDNPQPLWSLQPNEPAADYQLFAAWLQLPAPRRSRKAAPALGCSLYRLRQLSKRHRWKTRAAAFDQHRAHASSVALDQLVRDETASWKERAQRFRIAEWLLHEEILEAAHQAVHQFENHPGRATFRDILALYELAFDLGRRACGMPLDPAAVPAAQSKPPSGYLDCQAALEKIYGQPLPGEESPKTSNNPPTESFS